MTLQTVETELDVIMATGITSTLTKSCGKDTGTVGSEVRETTDPTRIVTVSGIELECPDPVIPEG